MTRNRPKLGVLRLHLRGRQPLGFSLKRSRRKSSYGGAALVFGFIFDARISFRRLVVSAGTVTTHALSPWRQGPALMITHFLRTFHSLRNTSNSVWSLSFLRRRMRWDMRSAVLSLGLQPGVGPRDVESEQEGSPGPPPPAVTLTNRPPSRLFPPAKGGSRTAWPTPASPEVLHRKSSSRHGLECGLLLLWPEGRRQAAAPSPTPFSLLLGDFDYLLRSSQD